MSKSMMVHLILGFLEFVKDKAPTLDGQSGCQFLDVIKLCAAPESDYMDDAMWVSDKDIERLISEYVESLKGKMK